MNPNNTKRKVIIAAVGFLFLLVSLGVGVFLNQQIQKTNVGAAGANLTLTTNVANPKVNDTIVVAVSMNTNGYSVTGTDLKIKYDATRLTATNIQAGNFLPYIFIPGSISNGVASIVLGCPIDTTGPHPVSGTGLIAQITFTVKAAGATSITFDSGTKVSASGQTINMLGTTNTLTITAVNPTITPIPTPTKSPSPVPTRSPSPSPIRSPSPIPTRSPSPSPIACGGIGGILCPAGKTCVYSNGSTTPPTPDAMGTCKVVTKSPTPIPTKSPSPVPTKSPSPRPTPTGIRKAGDVNNDGIVNIVDIGIIIDNYSLAPLPDHRADLNGDGIANIVDIGIVVDYYEF